MLCRVHTADLRTVALSAVVRAAASDTLDKYHFLRCLSVRETLQMSLCRTCGIHDTLQLKGCDDILALRIGILVIFIKLDHIEARRYHNRAVLLCDDLILLIVIDCPRLADL